MRVMGYKQANFSEVSNLLKKTLLEEASLRDKPSMFKLVLDKSCLRGGFNVCYILSTWRLLWWCLGVKIFTL